MKKLMKILVLITLINTVSCAKNFYINENSSRPLNKQEEAQYRQVASRCFKAGGTRVVKIGRKLECF